MRVARERLTHALRRAVRWGRDKLPPGVRSLVGLLLIAGGFLGFLPVLGFWMVPVGAALVALDIPALRRRLVAWAERDKPERDEPGGGGREGDG